MPTQEERIQTLEFDLKQFKTETIKVYQDMAMEVTLMKGLTEDAVKRLMRLRMQVDERFAIVDQRLDKMDQRLDKMDQRLDKMDQRLDKMDQRLDKMDQRLSAIEQHGSKTDQHLIAIETLLSQIIARLPHS